MKYFISIFFLLLVLQLPAQDSIRRLIRVVDTLSVQEKKDRVPLILRSELDSLIKVHSSVATQQSQLQEPVVKDESTVADYLLWSIVALLLLVIALAWTLYRNQQKFSENVFLLNRQIKNLELATFSINSTDHMNSKVKSKVSVPALEKKIQALTGQLEKASKTNEELEQQVKEYADSKMDFESVKQQMMEVYKIRNYPGFNKEKSETEVVRSLLETERAIALYAYDHFLKPVMAIADSNKNNPARINPEEREKVLDLLISLALLYSEYLYLRINDLSVGGKIVERIGGLRNGNNIDTGLLKELNIEHGSRALVLRMILDKMNVQRLSYPVFDETNLNLS